MHHVMLMIGREAKGLPSVRDLEAKGIMVSAAVQRKEDTTEFDTGSMQKTLPAVAIQKLSLQKNNTHTP